MTANVLLTGLLGLQLLCKDLIRSIFLHLLYSSFELEQRVRFERVDDGLGSLLFITTKLVSEKMETEFEVGDHHGVLLFELGEFELTRKLQKSAEFRVIVSQENLSV